MTFVRGMRRPAKAGRRAGTPNKRTEATVKLVRQAQEYLSPLEYLSAILDDESQPQATRIAAATVLLPYRHPRLSVIEQRVDQVTTTITAEERLRREEQVRLEAVAAIDAAFQELPGEVAAENEEPEPEFLPPPEPEATNVIQARRDYARPGEPDENAGIEHDRPHRPHRIPEF